MRFTRQPPTASTGAGAASTSHPRPRARAWWCCIALLVGLVVGAGVATPADASRWAPSAPYVSPITPFDLVTLARLPAQRWLPGHRGVDLATEVGAPVSSPADGIVITARQIVDRGVVTVQHDDGGLTSLEPVDATLSPGDRVRQGDIVGTVGDQPGHCAPRTCVHWGVRVDGEYIDPLDVLAGYGPIRLLPRSAGAFTRRLPCGSETPAAS